MLPRRVVGGTSALQCRGSGQVDDDEDGGYKWVGPVQRAWLVKLVMMLMMIIINNSRRTTTWVGPVQRKGGRTSAKGLVKLMMMIAMFMAMMLMMIMIIISRRPTTWMGPVQMQCHFEWMVMMITSSAERPEGEGEHG